VLPDPGQPLLVARVSWPGRAARTEFEQWLFGQVRQRRTHRGGFDPAPLPSGLLAALREGAARYGTVLRIVADDGRRAVLAAAVAEAERAQRLDGERARELAEWAPAPGSSRTDGVPPDSYPARAEHTDPDFPGRDYAHGHGWGLPPLSTAAWPRSAGVAALLTTAQDRPADWVNAGQGLQRILLTAAAFGAAAALHTQPLEFGRLRESIRTRLSDGAYPQLVLRFGTVIQAEASIRRPPADVLSASGSAIAAPARVEGPAPGICQRAFAAAVPIASTCGWAGRQLNLRAWPEARTPGQRFIGRAALRLLRWPSRGSPCQPGVNR